MDPFTYFNYRIKQLHTEFVSMLDSFGYYLGVLDAEISEADKPIFQKVREKLEQSEQLKKEAIELLESTDLIKGLKEK